jgi:hypothetical protein
LPIKFGPPDPPHLAIINPIMFTIEMLVGFVLLLGVTVIVDKLGTAMFHRGFAKPFYIKGHRIHHSVIYSIIPIAYGIFSILYFFGYVRLTWSIAGDQLAILALLIAFCIAIDAIGDKFWPEIRKNVILHHEWIYSIIPAYLFAQMIIIVI